MSSAGADSEEVEAILQADELSDTDVEDIFEPEDLALADLIDDPENSVDPAEIDEPNQEAIDAALAALKSSESDDEEKQSILSKIGEKGADFGKALYQNLSLDDIGVFIAAAQGDETARKNAMGVLGKGAGKAALTQAGLSQEDAEALVAMAADKPAGPGNPKKMSGKFKKGDKLPLNSYQEREDGEGWQSKAGQKTQSKRRQKKFRTEKGARNHAMKEANIVVSKMRGYVLRATNDFRRSSSLTPTEVISEYYRLGGTNKMILSEMKSTNQPSPFSRWSVLAGVDNNE